MCVWALSCHKTPTLTLITNDITSSVRVRWLSLFIPSHLIWFELWFDHDGFSFFYWCRCWCRYPVSCGTWLGWRDSLFVDMLLNLQGYVESFFKCVVRNSFHLSLDAIIEIIHELSHDGFICVNKFQLSLEGFKLFIVLLNTSRSLKKRSKMFLHLSLKVWRHISFLHVELHVSPHGYVSYVVSPSFSNFPVPPLKCMVGKACFS